MAENQQKLTAQSTALDETEDRQKQVPWNDLTPYVLEMIYSFLCRKDQVNMSVVCRSWSERYGTPSVWKEFVFDLRESQLLESNSHYMRFAEKYSRMFRKVKIYCHNFCNRHMYNIWSRRFINFLQILMRNSQLESVEFGLLGFCLNCIDNTNVCEAIAEFLRSQHDLKMAEFFYCQFSYNEGKQLLKILAEKSGQSLKRLIIRKFFACNSDEEQILNDLEEFPRILAFTNLTTLETDYSLVLEYLLAFNSNEIQTFEKNEKHVFSKVILHHRKYIDKALSKSQVLTSDRWKILTTMLPYLQVEIFIDAEEKIFENMEVFIKANMPIVNLVYFYSCHQYEIEIKALFNHLLTCKTNEYLNTLAFQCISSKIRDFNSFISFVQVCTKLERLALEALDPFNAINFMESLMNRSIENQSETLKNVYIVDSRHLKSSLDYPNVMRTFHRISPRLRFNLELSDCSIFQKFITYL